MMKLLLTYLLGAVVLCYRGGNDIPLVKSKSGQYYAQLRIGGRHKPRILFRLDFNSSQSYIDASVLGQTSGKKQLLEVLTSRNRRLGFMNFAVLPTNVSLTEYKGMLGLGLNNTLIQMLEKNFRKPDISLRIQLVASKINIEFHPCRNPRVGPFKVSLQTWTTVNYLTALSFNFHPSEDFLALINKTRNNFQMPSQDYQQKRIQISTEDQQRNLKLKRLVSCWNFDSNGDLLECQIKTSTPPDVGRLLFAFPIKVCKDGIDIGVTLVVRNSYVKYFMVIIAVNLVLIVVFFKKSHILDRFKSSQDPDTNTSQNLQQQ